MHAGEVFRVVRRRRGWSQRQLAEAAGISARTVASIEAGRHQPSVAVLTAVVSAGGLELDVDLPIVELEPPDLRFLTLSTTRRLALALGVRGRPSLVGRQQPLYVELVAAARTGRLTLHGPAACAVWLRPAHPLEEVAVCGRVEEPARPEGARIRHVEQCEGHVAAPVAVALASWTVRVDPPAELALRTEHVPDRHRLRAVARVLDGEAARDEAGRRTRAHAEPHHWLDAESSRWLTKSGPLPDLDDRRGWRLRDVASVRAWLDAARWSGTTG